MLRSSARHQRPRRGIPRGTLPTFQELESRVVLATHVMAEYFPLFTASRWDFTGEIDSQHVTPRLVSQVGGSQAGLTTVRFRETGVVPGDGPYTDDSYFAYAADGLRYMRLADLGISDLRFGAGLQVTPSVAQDGRTYTSSQPVTGTVEGESVTGTASLTTTIMGLESITVPAGTFTSLHLDVALAATIRAGSPSVTVNYTGTQHLWLVRNIGMARIMESSDIVSSDGSSEHLESDLSLTASSRLRVLTGIEVLGNSMTIAPGDVTPTTADHTAFGALDVDAGARTRVFTVHNTSAAPINFLGGAGGARVRIDGLNASDFTLTRDLDVASLAPGQSATFSVRFDPGALGARAATVGVMLDRAAPTPDGGYFFDIRGSGVHLGRIAVRRPNAAQPITSGSLVPTAATGTLFGSALAAGNATTTRNYTISNPGLGNLVLNGSLVRIEGPNALDFVVVLMPASPVAPSGTTTFRVVFNPSAAGTRSAVVRIFSNDPTTPQFWFTISGTGL